MTIPQPRTDPRAGPILGRAVLAAASDLGLSQKQLARVLGISEATSSRLSQGRPIDPSAKEGELALLLLRVYRSLDALVGGSAADAKAWLHAPNDHLAGTPADLIQTAVGLVNVAEYLDAMRGKI